VFFRVRRHYKKGQKINILVINACFKFYTGYCFAALFCLLLLNKMCVMLSFWGLCNCYLDTLHSRLYRYLIRWICVGQLVLLKSFLFFYLVAWSLWRFSLREQMPFKYYLKHERECFMKYKTTAESLVWGSTDCECCKWLKKRSILYEFIGEIILKNKLCLSRENES
jgi:hypothetical protein